MRFQDNGETLSDIIKYRIVKCPKCSHSIKYEGAQLACKKCGYIKKSEDITELEKFIKIRCCGEILWAANLEHLNFIEEYVAAKLRERKPNVNKSLASRLPTWIKEKSNRDKILKAIKKFKNEFGTQL